MASKHAIASKASSAKSSIIRNQSKHLLASNLATVSTLGVADHVHSGYKTAKKELVDNKKEECILISPGYHMTRKKDRISVTLGEEFFGTTFQTKVDKESPPRKVAQCEIDDLIEDFQDQIGHLKALLEQEKRDHRKTKDVMTQVLKDSIATVEQTNAAETRKLREIHAIELHSVREQSKATLEKQIKEVQHKYDHLRDEYDFLKSAFQAYKENLVEELSEKQSFGEAEWKKLHEKEKEKALLEQKHTLTKNFEKEQEEILSNVRNEILSMQENHFFEKQELWQEYIKAIEDIKQKTSHIEAELDEKKENLLNSKEALKQAKQELEKMKSQAQGTQEAFHQKISGISENFDQIIHSLMKENEDLRRKLIVKSEELLSEKIKEKIGSTSRSTSD
uniref:Flagellum-associated coiled-coil domain-containing protein 1 isoform X2 n=1 Tax=Geotrypetes seraphini TaxID=260995 RepID=A0A6P8QZQ3_GEOSA|nr:flagellum-associated coiled-coil domain-containing protein 1 isoform X2 [Geotrypetes seraphini]